MKTVINKSAIIYIMAFGLSSAVTMAEPKEGSALSDLPGRPMERVQRVKRAGVAGLFEEADVRFQNMTKVIFKKEHAEIAKNAEIIKNGQVKIQELESQARELEKKYFPGGFEKRLKAANTVEEAVWQQHYLADREKFKQLKKEIFKLESRELEAMAGLKDAQRAIEYRTSVLQEKGIVALENGQFPRIYGVDNSKYKISPEGKSAYREFAAWLEGRPALRKLARWGGILGVGVVAAEAATASAQAATAPVKPVELNVPDSPEHGGPTGEAGGEAPVY